MSDNDRPGQGDNSQKQEQSGDTPQLLPPRPPVEGWGSAPNNCLDPRARNFALSNAPPPNHHASNVQFPGPGTQVGPTPTGGSVLFAPHTPYGMSVHPRQQQEIRDENSLHRERLTLRSDQLFFREHVRVERDRLDNDRRRFQQQRDRWNTEYQRQLADIQQQKEQLALERRNQAMIRNRLTQLGKDVEAHEAQVAAKERALTEMTVRVQEREATLARREREFHDNLVAFLKERGDLPSEFWMSRVTTDWRMIKRDPAVISNLNRPPSKRIRAKISEPAIETKQPTNHRGKLQDRPTSTMAPLTNIPRIDETPKKYDWQATSPAIRALCLNGPGPRNYDEMDEPPNRKQPPHRGRPGDVYDPKLEMVYEFDIKKLLLKPPTAFSPRLPHQDIDARAGGYVGVDVSSQAAGRGPQPLAEPRDQPWLGHTAGEGLETQGQGDNGFIPGPADMNPECASRQASTPGSAPGWGQSRQGEQVQGENREQKARGRAEWLEEVYELLLDGRNMN
ncbi:hypothetical protein V8F20_001890 [Naviculisporaceae sp. PSN 640]